MSKWILRNILFTCLLTVTSSQLLAETEHFWLLHETGIEKRSIDDGSLLEQVVQLYKPLTFAVDETNQKIWAVSDGYISSYDLEGKMLASSELENINQGARLIANSQDGGAWLSHKGEIYHYNDTAQRLSTTELKLPGNQINDIVLDATDSTLWLTSGNQVISISSEGDVEQHELDKDETATGIAVTESQDIAITITTPKPEFRIYNQNFELQTTISLPQEATNPVRIATSGENNFWVAAKQSVVLVDSSSGVVTNHPLTGELGLGPGEIDVIANEGDNAWVSVGRSLWHIEPDTGITYKDELLNRSIEIQSTRPSLISDSVPPVIFLFKFTGFSRGGRYFTPPLPIGYGSEITIITTDTESDVDIFTLEITIDSKKLTTQIKVAYTLAYPTETDATCIINPNSLEPYQNQYTGELSNPPKWFHCVLSRSLLDSLAEKSHTIEVSISDNAGNTTHTGQTEFLIDKTPPDPVNLDLVNTEQTNDDVITITGKPGAISRANELLHSDGSLRIYNMTRYTRYSNSIVKEDGSFSFTTTGYLGDRLLLITPGFNS